MDAKQLMYHSMYIDIAKRVGEMSYAQRKKVGCICVKDGRIISMGWNGTPSGFDNRCEIEVDNKLETRKEVLHAELNCISKLAKSTESSSGSSMYLTLSPCFECAKLIKQSEIKQVFYTEQYRDLAGIEFLKEAGVEVIQLV
jgi:dCMP deaminase